MNSGIAAESAPAIHPVSLENVPDERDFVLLGNIIMLAMNTRIARQRQPRCRSDADAAQQIDPVALGGKHQVEAWRLFAAAIKIKVRINRPESGRPAICGQVIAQS